METFTLLLDGCQQNEQLPPADFCLQSIVPGNLSGCEVKDGFRFSFVVLLGVWIPQRLIKGLKAAVKWSCSLSFFYFIYADFFILNKLSKNSIWIADVSCGRNFWLNCVFFLFFYGTVFLLVPRTHQISCYIIIRLMMRCSIVRRKQPEVEPSTVNETEITTDTTSWKFWHQSRKAIREMFNLSDGRSENVVFINNAGSCSCVADCIDFWCIRYLLVAVRAVNYLKRVQTWQSATF